MNNLKREYPCKDWWWIRTDTKIDRSDITNKTTRSLEKSIESLKFAMKFTRDSEQLKLDQQRLDKYCEELEGRKINLREGDIF